MDWSRLPSPSPSSPQAVEPPGGVSNASSPSGKLASPRLRRLATDAAARAPAQTEPEERCELCGAAIASEHRHVLDLDSREILCACRPCSIMMDRPAAGGGHWRLIPERRQRLTDFTLDDLSWDRLQIPVDMAFFFRSSVAERVMAFYPGPMGATESHLELEAWTELEAVNPVLETLAPDVEALLVNRARGARRQWIVPIDDCYRLVAVIRMRWRGFTGGKEVWEQIEQFFADLDRMATERSR
jgi:hypothetical protein